MKLRVAVISDIEAGSQRAHAINVIKTAGGFASLGCRTAVICRRSSDGSTPAELSAAFAEPDITWSFVEDEIPATAFGEAALSVAIEQDCDVVYARHFGAALAAHGHGVPTLLETHAWIGARNPELDACLAATRAGDQPLEVSTISACLRAHYIDRGAAPERVCVVPDGVDPRMFTGPMPARPTSLSHEKSRCAVVYTGHLYPEKGIATLIDAVDQLDEFDLHLVGGLPEDVAHWRGVVRELSHERISIHGMQPYADVPSWTRHADVLVLPPSGRDPSAQWTSPVKLAEYLASDVPVIASRIPGLTAWVDEPEVTWFTPDDVASLANRITQVSCETPEDRETRLCAMRRAAARFTYKRRAAQMLAAIQRDAVVTPCS